MNKTWGLTIIFAKLPKNVKAARDLSDLFGFGWKVLGKKSCLQCLGAQKINTVDWICFFCYFFVLGIGRWTLLYWVFIVDVFLYYIFVF